MRVVFGPEVFGQRYGGISRYFVELHRRLPALGVSSTIVAGAHHNTYLPGVSGVRGIPVPLAIQKERLRPLRDGLNGTIASGYLRMNPRAVYHQTYYGGSVARMHRGPHVVTAYDLVHAKFPEHFPADDPTVRQQREAFARADLIISISHTTKTDLEAVFGVAASRITVTHLGVAPPEVRATDRVGVEGPFLLYVGQRFGYKNWERFVRAFAQSGLARHLRVVCTGLPFLVEEEELVANLGLAGIVRHLPADDALLDALYRAATTFVYPSLYEGFGLPPLEAMARGCPVVAARAGALPEVLGDAAVYADPMDVESLAAALVEGARPERRVELARRGRAVAATYTWERTAALTATAYRSLA